MYLKQRKPKDGILVDLLGYQIYYISAVLYCDDESREKSGLLCSSHTSPLAVVAVAALSAALYMEHINLREEVQERPIFYYLGKLFFIKIYEQIPETFQILCNSKIFDLKGYNSSSLRSI